MCRYFILLILIAISDITFINAHNKIDMFEKLNITAEQVKELDSTTFDLIAKNKYLSKISKLKLYHIFWLWGENYKKNRSKMMNCKEYIDSCNKTVNKFNCENYSNYIEDYNNKYKLNKEEIINGFLNYSFLDRLQVIYNTVSYRNCNVPIIKYLFKEKKERFLCVQTLITDSVGNLVGISFGHKLAVQNTIDGMLSGNCLPSIDCISTDTTDFTHKLAKMFLNNEIDFVFIIGFYNCFIIKENKVYIRKKEYTEDSNGKIININKILPLENFMECCYDDRFYFP